MKKNKAVLIIDVQNAMFDGDYPIYNGSELLNRLQSLINRARAEDIPIVYVQHNNNGALRFGSHSWEVHQAIQPRVGDNRIYKETPDSFYNTDLEAVLKEKGITKLVVAGIQSDVCVDTTTRRAFSLGYEVTLAADAHSTWQRGELTARHIIDHHNDVLKWFAEVKNTAEIELD